MQKRFWIAFSGVVWLVVGVMLLTKGIFWMGNGMEGWTESTLLLLLFGALFVGILKGRYVLSKTVTRIYRHIADLPEPLSWKKIYPRSYVLVLGLMMGMGMGLKYVPLPSLVRGSIDVAIGAALIQGSLLYFRFALDFLSKKE